MTKMKQAKIKINGKVQGVFFRSFVEEEAKKRGIVGYAKNLMDGGVEVLAQGEEDKINDLLGKCKKGPPSADVQEINFQREQPNKKYEDFITL